MLESAWRSSRPGSIPSSFTDLAIITRLPVTELELHYGVLTAGWDLLADGRLHYAQLEEIANSITDRFGPQLGVIADAAVVAIQGGLAEFELLPATEVVKKKRGRHLIPKDFTFDKTTLSHVMGEGFTTEQFQQWLMRSFNDFACAKNVMYTNWQAACRNFTSSDITRRAFKSRFGHFPGEMQISTMAEPGYGSNSAADRLRVAMTPTSMTFQQRTTAVNSAKMHKPSPFMAQACASDVESSAQRMAS